MLHGLYTGWLTPARGAFGRTLLGRQPIKVTASPASGSDSLVSRVLPNAVVGDILITSLWVAPGNYALRVNEDGTYRYNAFGDQSQQLMTVDGFNRSFSTLYGEGALTLNDAPPQPATGSGTTFYPGLTLTINQVVNIQLVAKSPNGNAITFSISAGTLPTGLSMTSAGLVTGTTTAFGTFNVTTRITDSFGSYTDVVDQITVSNSLPNFVGQLVSQVTPQATALGLTVNSSATLPSAQPIYTVLGQVPASGTPITPGGTIYLTVSDGSLSVGNPNLFPQNIKGVNWDGARTYVWKSLVQTAITGKTSALLYSQYPLVEWELNYDVLDQAAAIDDLKKIVGLFNQTQGSNGTFLYEDPQFNAVTAQAFGTGDGTTKTFQLVAQNSNASGPGKPEIVQAVAPSPAALIYDNGSLVSSSNYAIGPTGIVTFTTAPANTHALTWTGSFFYNCKFEADMVDPNQFMATYWSLATFKFRSVIL